MDKLLYVAMSGASQTMLAQAANNNNLANASTTGFRADLSAFRAMPVFGPGAPSRVYAMAERPGTDYSFGSLLSTGRDLDVAVKGDGWIAVQGPDGSEGYTRAGDLRVSNAGLLENGAGHLVLGNSGPIAIPPAEKIDIGADGTVSILPVGQSASSLVVVDRIKLVKPALQDLKKDGDGLMRMQDDSVLPPDAGVGLSSGTLEASNVNPVDAMVNMISLARQFEMQVKMMRTSQENDASAAQILRMS